MTYRLYTEIEVEEHSSLFAAIESALEQDMGPEYEGDSGFRRPWVETEDGEVVWAAGDFDNDRWPAELSAEQIEELKAVKSMFDRIWDHIVPSAGLKRAKEKIMMHCRACGTEVASEDEVKSAIQREYNYSDEELGRFDIRVWHISCAVADGRIDPGDEDDPSVVPDGFVWSVVPH